jgi:hypothetical protein
VSGFDVHVSPEPAPDDREAILAAVREVLRREEALARPSPWRLAGWTAQRVGVRDLGFSPDRRWALSARLPLGGRIFSGMNGRGDAK